GVHEFVQGSVYLMLHVLFDVELEVGPVVSTDRYRLKSFQIRPKDSPVGSQHCILVEPNVVEIQPTVSAVAIVAHRPNEQGKDCDSTLDEVLQEIHCLVVVVYLEKVEQLSSVVSDSPIRVEVDSDVGRDQPCFLDHLLPKPPVPVHLGDLVLKCLWQLYDLHQRGNPEPVNGC